MPKKRKPKKLFVFGVESSDSKTSVAVRATSLQKAVKKLAKYACEHDEGSADPQDYLDDIDNGGLSVCEPLEI